MLHMLLVSVLASGADTPPSPPREFRAVWVATVANIDWPSKKGLPAKQQQAELLAILDRAKQLRLNAIVLQVRPMCDALYSSKLEPWSEFLTGTLGKDPGWDPLAFAVKEAHARGLELHAWFNPYRARSPAATSPTPDSHLVKKRPDLAPRYGKHHWLIPTITEVQDHSLAVFLDVVKRYDVDGVHIDDYFYPYKEKNENGTIIPFPDDVSWNLYQATGGKLLRDDWRRDAVNRFVERLYAEVKKTKRHVKVGISPFGIWRPGHPKGIEGFDQYAELYADAKLWLNKGWIDYWTPQLYWPIKQEKQSYPKLLAWWTEENTERRHVWPGNYTSRAASGAKGWSVREIADQVLATRARKGATGNVHFSMKALMHQGGVAAELAKVYDGPALVPASPWLGKEAPNKPTLVRRETRAEFALGIKQASDDVLWHVVRSLSDDKWTIEIVPVGIDWKQARPAQRVVVTSINRVGLESEPVEWKP